MELKAGYKRTDVGVIPREWRVHTIGGAMKLINGRAFKPEDWKQRGVPIIRIQNLNDPGGTFNYCDTPVLEKHRVEAGDVLFAWSGTTGTSFGARIWNGPTGVLNQHIFKVLADPEKLTPVYSFLILQRVQEEIEKQAHGFKASFVHVKKTDLVKVGLPVPSLREQEAIAEAMSDADALIESLEQLLAKKRNLKQGAMQELLTGKRRLPGFEVKAGHKQTQFGPIPEDWEVARLGALCSMKSGEGITSANIDQGSPFPCYGGNGLRGFAARYTHDGAYALIGRQGALCGNVLGVEGKFFASEHAIVATASAQTDIRWLTVALGEMRLNQYSESSAQPGLSVAKLLALELAYPPTKEEQEAIALILLEMDAEVAALEEKLTKARNLKQGMMQELLTGRIRLV